MAAKKRSTKQQKNRAEAIEKLHDAMGLLVDVSDVVSRIQGKAFGRFDHGNDEGKGGFHPETLGGFAKLTLHEAGGQLEQALYDLGLYDGRAAFFLDAKGGVRTGQEVAHG